MSLTISDIAEMANTSVATISRVLSGKPGVSQKRREEILELLERVGYRSNLLARNLSLGKSGLLGVSILDLRIPFYARLVSYIERRVASFGYHLMVMESHLDSELEKRNIETLLQHQVEGIFVIPVYDYDKRVDLDHFIKLKADRFPFVFLSRVDGVEFDWVTIEDISTAYNLVDFLYRKGHRSFAFMGHSPDNRIMCDRFEGVNRALRDRGIRLPMSNVMEEPVGSSYPRDIQTWEPIVREVFSRSERPTALVAVHDTIALIAIRNLKSMGIRVPEDVSVAGFDDRDFARLIDPPITTHSQDLEKVGTLAVDILMERIKNPEGEPIHREIPQILIERSSTGDYRESKLPVVAR